MNTNKPTPDGVHLLMDLIMEQPERAKRKSITAGEWFGCGKTITQESWDAFIAARKEYYDSLDYYDKLDAENNLPGSLAPTDSTVQEEQGRSGELGLTE